MSKPKQQSLSLGELQSEVELATKDLKMKRTASERENAAFADAEERYAQARRALINGVNTLNAQTKMPF